MDIEKLEIGKKYEIHGYKHDGKIHRSWDEAVLLEIHDDYLIFGNEKTKVTGQYKKNGIYYYCNMASPFIIEENTIKYIDYDLDLRVFPDGSFKVLDRGEYKYHKSIMSYPERIDKILKYELTNLINMVREKRLAFKPGVVEHYCNLYTEKKEK